MKWRIAVSILIVCTAIGIKHFADKDVVAQVSSFVNGGIDYKEAVSAIGRAIGNDEEIIEVFDKESLPDEESSEESEQASAVELSFEMTPEELSDDTKAVPFTIPPPSYCSYEKVSVAFEHTTPVYGTVTSPYGYRDHPIGGKASFHTGLDIAAKSGTAVSCFASGKVLEAGYNDTYGNYILVEHEGGICSFYGHNSKLNVKSGAKVKMGQKIAEVGTTGLSTGPHLHFEVRKGKMRLDPKYYIAPERI